MKTTFQFLGLDIHSSWYRILEQRVEYWQHLTAVRATEVVIERQSRGKLAFRVQVTLEVSSGNLHAEAFARTPKAALLLAGQDLETQIQARKAERVERRATHHHPAAAPAGGFILKPLVPEGGHHASRSALPPVLTQPQLKAKG
jgi:ribosome-associated translation inhibitor RaiA